MNTVKLDLTGLRTLRRQLGELEAHHVEVGLFRATAGRVSDPGRVSENPSLGFIHENGDPKHNIPARSWLKLPMMTQLGPVMLAKGASWLFLLRTRGAKATLAVLGAIGEDLIQEAFATRGWGAWPSLQPATIRRKKSSAILIESAQMRKAVAYRVI